MCALSAISYISIFGRFARLSSDMGASWATQYKKKKSKVLRRAFLSAARYKSAVAAVAAVKKALGRRYCLVRHARHALAMYLHMPDRCGGADGGIYVQRDTCTRLPRSPEFFCFADCAFLPQMWAVRATQHKWNCFLVL